MDEDILERCQKEIKSRLGKYDVVRQLDSATQNEINTRISELHEDIQKILNKEVQGMEDKKKLEQMEKAQSLMADIIKKLFPDEQNIDTSFVVFNALTDTIVPVAMPKHSAWIPDTHKYAKMKSDLQVLENKCYWVYEKDISRAIAYHKWLLALKIKETDFRGTTSYQRNEYNNVPIDIRVCAEKEYYYWNCDIGGGIIIQTCAMQGREVVRAFKEIFKKKESEFNSNGEFEGKKEKGVGYDNFIKSIELLTGEKSIKNPMYAEDIWFFKNILNPELIFALSREKEGSNLRQSDYKLLWFLCGIKCPSVSFFTFEAISPYYFYIRKYANSEDDPAMKFFFDELAEIVKKINENFENMVSLIAYLDQCLPEAHWLETMNERFNEMFREGDDLSLLVPDKLYDLNLHDDSRIFSDKNINKIVRKVAKEGDKECEKESEKERVYHYYYQYIPSEQEDRKNSAGKIAYAVITALNEQWKLTDREKMQSEPGTYVRQGGNLQGRLYHHFFQNK